MSVNLADFLKEARTNAGLTQGKVAEILGYTTPQFISNWERGMSFPPIDVLRKIAGLYKISEEELYSSLEFTFLEQTKLDLRRKFQGAVLKEAK